MTDWTLSDFLADVQRSRERSTEADLAKAANRAIVRAATLIQHRNLVDAEMWLSAVESLQEELGRSPLSVATVGARTNGLGLMADFVRATNGQHPKWNPVTLERLVLARLHGDSATVARDLEGSSPPSDFPRQQLNRGLFRSIRILAGNGVQFHDPATQLFLTILPPIELR